jgi:glycerophosphoryl diester phosphodiesterase
MTHGATAATVPRAGATPPLVLAHRGAWDQAPQNSLAAIRRAAALGCDGVEIDVRRTADGRLVVVHDARLGWRAVSRLTHQQVQARMQAGQAPLLGEVLDAASAERLLLDIELKEDGYVDEVVTLVQRHLPPDSHVFTSFATGVLAQVKRLVPETRTGLLLAPRAARLAARRLRETGADFLLPHVSLVRTGIVDWAASQGLASWVWTVNEDAAIQALNTDPRVAALITDRPAGALQMVGSS